MFQALPEIIDIYEYDSGWSNKINPVKYIQLWLYIVLKVYFIGVYYF